MNLLPRRTLLAILAVVDVSLCSRRGSLRTSTAFAARHNLPERYLEPVFRTLVKAKILKAVRGRRGGYRLARESHLVSLADVARVAGSVPSADPASSRLPFETLIQDSFVKAGRPFLANLELITIADLCERAVEAGLSQDET